MKFKNRLVAMVAVVAFTLSILVSPMSTAPAQAANVPCSMSQSYYGSYLTCDGKKVKVFTTIFRDRQISTGFTDGSGHWVNVYSATWYNISARHQGVTFYCSMSWGGLCQ